MSKTKFPPVDWLWKSYEQNAAWYSGDPQRLKQQAAGAHPFWRSDENIKIHVPIAADLSALSAGMIFATSPEIDCEDETTKARIDEVFESAGVYAVLLQAAELASAYGGVFLKWSWDEADGFPRLTAVPADAGMPYWKGGKIAAIRLWTIVREEEGGRVYRLEEEYTPDGRIRSRLRMGDDGNLGTEVNLDSIDETRGILPEAYCGADAMLATYVPNMLPNRIAPHLRFGRSDYDGLHGLFDALDEAYSSIQRETRLTKTMVVVPLEYLKKKESIRHKFDSEAKEAEWVFPNAGGAFVALDIDTTENSSPITVVNPELRCESRIAGVDDIVRRILHMAGYAPQSAGLDIEGAAESGEALNVRERKTIRTSEVKKTYWWHAVVDMLRAMLKLDAAVFRSGVKPDAEFSVELPSGTQPDIARLAQIVEQLERAGAASLETKISMLHPEWSDAQIAEEIAKIRDESGAQARLDMERILGMGKMQDDGGEPAENGGEPEGGDA